MKLNKNRMQTNALRLALGTVAIGFLSIAASAYADGSYTVTSTDPGAQSAPFSAETFTLAGFDTSLGTLTGVSVSLNGTIIGTDTITNSTTGTVTLPSTVTTSVPYVLTLTGGSFSDSYQATTTIVSGKVGSGTTTNSGSAQLKDDGNSISTTDFSIFQSGSPVTFNLAGSSAVFSEPAVAGIAYSGESATLDSNVSVTYTYSDLVAVPEPSTWMSVAAALGSVIYIRRRSQKSARV
jgi:hypothetical protein